MKLVICEKPSVGAAVAAALGVREKKDGYIEGNGYVISWCIGHLVGLAEAAAYGEQYRKWSYDSLPILPQEWQYTVAADKGKQFKILKDLMHRADVSEVVNACDAGREGELIFRFVYEMAGCKKPFTRLWISSMETDAIRSGFEHLKDGRGYDTLYHSALCRAKADWLIGINATRLFSCLYGKTLNVGRVQTPTLKMLVDRDAAITNFKKEKEPEPGAVRKGTSQPELDARSHEEVIPRNDAAEKQNEIPGRQIPSQTDPLVEIRSAVHSNYAGMVAMLGADNRVYLGREERCHYQNMQPSYYDNQDGSLCFVCDQPDMYYFLYGEGWAHTQAEMLERGLTLRQYEEFARLQNGVLAQFTTQREILFAGQPFQAPESYLRNAELYEEGQTGNYNMLDGRLNNEPPVRPDLTDGQTDEEIRELVPEAKPSLMDRLKADKPEHEARQMIPPVPERER